MDGLFNIADREGETRWFLGPDESALARPFHIPKWATAVYILAAGAGGGGGGGMTGVAGTTRGGGGGGGGGSSVAALFPALLLPETIWFLFGTGGPGGAATIAGSPGGATCIGISPGLAAGDIRNLIQVTGGGGGNPGTGSLGTGGARGVPSFVSAGAFGTGFWNIGSGTTGASASASGKGGNVQFVTTAIVNPILGGAGGGGGNASDAAGGDVTATNVGYEPLSLTISGGAVGGNSGASGIFSRRPFYSTGGSAGGFLHNGTGGNGGNGAPAAGGGGAGAGTTGGVGGNGGDGFAFVVIV